MRADFSGGLLDDSAAIVAGLDGYKCGCGCKPCHSSNEQTRRADRSNEFSGAGPHKPAARDCFNSKTRDRHAGRDLDFARRLGGGTQNRQAAPDFQFAGDDLRHRLKQWRDGFGHWKFGRDMERNRNQSRLRAGVH